MNRKYPFIVFLFMLALNFLIRHFYLWIPGVIFCFIGNQRALSAGIALLLLDLIVSVIEQLKIRKTVLSESDNEDFNQLMDEFYGEPEPVQSERHAILEKLVVNRTLRDSVREDMDLDELIDAFRQMCAEDVGDPDDLLFETGVYRFTGEKKFHFSLVRQFKFMDADEYVQLRLDITAEPPKAFVLPVIHWGKVDDGTFFDFVRNSRGYKMLKDAPFQVVVRIEET